MLITYKLHVSINEKGQLFIHLVNMKQPFSTQLVKSTENKEVLLQFHGVLSTHTNYTIYTIKSKLNNVSEIPEKYQHTIEIEAKLFKQLLSNYILIDETVFHFQFKKKRCCC